MHHPESDAHYIGPWDGFADTAGCYPVQAEHLRLGTRVSVALGTSEVLPSIDFETFSAAGYVQDVETRKIRGMGGQGKGGLPVVGTPVYAEHPSTEVLCMYYNMKDGKGVQAWIPGSPFPADLFNYIALIGLVEAWNVTFEFWIWNMVCARRMGWPALPLEQCRCAMAKSRRHSLPGALGKAAAVLGTPEKDKAGGALIQKLCRPHTPTKKRPETRWTPQTAWPDFAALYTYCGQDTVAEDNASAHIPDLTPEELEVWQIDQRINVRGVQVDVAALDAALEILRQAEAKYNAELYALTGGAVSSVNEVAKVVAWAAVRGYNLPDLTKDTVASALKRNDAPPGVHRALQIRASLGAANVKKLRTLKLQVSSDGRLRDQYVYCGADRTGRWSAGGVQLQNITAKGPRSVKCDVCGGIYGRDVEDIGCPRCGQWLDREELDDWTVEAVEFAIADILTRDLDTVERNWGDPIALLCGCLRGLFIAAEGKKLVCCDFSAIEAVVAACLARCQWRIDLFNDPSKCIYTESASKITGTPVAVYEQYKAEHNGAAHPDRKKIGKVAELASGYGGWINAWRAFGAEGTDEEIKAQVLAWREASPEIVEMWGGQFKWCGPGKWDYRPELFGLEGAAINAILNPGKCFGHNDISYGVWDDILFCRLPSGRFLYYHRPRLANAEDRLNRGPCYSITFEGYNSNAAKGPVGWYRMDTFGGRLFENVTQAVARDVQAEALVRLERNAYPVVMHTHDEGCAEVPLDDDRSAQHMCDLMAERPSWASWWPIRAAGWTHKRYQKD